MIMIRSDPGSWYLDLKSGSGSAGPVSAGQSAAEFDVRFEMSSEDFNKMFNGQMSPTLAFTHGNMTIDGDIFLALKLDKIMKKLF
ncbi:unnamed protein product [Protopolystoma xenopodis]|uniref:SCP2 domain-containing protein n=1 Tax=Protopolystoma xenopodis TaxID=117903 RepID=A0A3S5FE84_9PLAT|nr:unnamed protein product [Protopolystoma xenopodis]